MQWLLNSPVIGKKSTKTGELINLNLDFVRSQESGTCLGVLLGKALQYCCDLLGLYMGRLSDFEPGILNEN